MNNAIDEAIANLEKLLASFERQGNMLDANRTAAELVGWREVREGREANVSRFHHHDYRARYLQARADAKALKGE